jgi:CelD/BcsL family acetyltransferase involved in cellulose biosynthesis
VTIDQPHAPTVACDGCRSLFSDDQDPGQATAADLEAIRHHRGYDTIRPRLDLVAAWLRPRRDRGQAIVEFALVMPILMALLLAILEAGSFGARWIGYAHLADTMTASAAATGTLPDWWAAEAARARCTDATAAVLPGAPRRVELRCTYQGIAVGGLAWSVTISVAIPD